MDKDVGQYEGLFLTQHNTQTHPHNRAPSGIQTHDSTFRVAA